MLKNEYGKDNVMYNLVAENNTIKIGNTELEFADEIKYLGKTLSKYRDVMQEITQNKIRMECIWKTKENNC